MDVIIDGAQDFELQGDPEDLVAVVAAVSEHLRTQGRTMVQLEVDGDNIAPEALTDKLSGVSPAGVGEMRVGSEAVTDLVNACLTELRTSLPELPEACRQLARVFQGETPDEGYDHFRELADIWMHVKQRERLVCGALGLGDDDLEVKGTKASLLFEELNGFLEEAAQALQDGDTVLLGDLLEYELAPRAEIETAIVDELQERARALSS